MSVVSVTTELVKNLINSKISIYPYPTQEDIKSLTEYMSKLNIEWHQQIKIGEALAFDANGNPINEFSDKAAKIASLWLHGKYVYPEKNGGDGAVYYEIG